MRGQRKQKGSFCQSDTIWSNEDMIDGALAVEGIRMDKLSSRAVLLNTSHSECIPKEYNISVGYDTYMLFHIPVCLLYLIILFVR
mgnify:CR=1 FL=1